MKGRKIIGISLAAFAAMMIVCMLDVSEVFALGPNDPGVPKAGDQVTIYNTNNLIATLGEYTSVVVKKSDVNGWENDLIFYFYKYNCTAPDLPYDADKIGSPLYKQGDVWYVDTLYYDMAVIEQSFASMSTEMVEQVLPLLVAKWDTGDDPAPCSTNGEVILVDHDTFKSELASKTVTASVPGNVAMFFDLKAHALGATDNANQAALAQAYARTKGAASAKCFPGYGIYPRRDLNTSENGAKMVLTWNNLPIKTPGKIYAVCYNQTDKAYIIEGTVDANGTATFPGYLLRAATNITPFILQ